jgi:thiol-disulfide isomerase/thioredoxin
LRAVVLELDASSFDGMELKGHAGVIGVCFHATWCGFCRSFLRLFRAAESGAPVPLALADVTAFEDPRWDTFDLRTVPTLVIFENGTPVWRRNAPLAIGLREKDLDAFLAAARRPPK